MCLEEYSLFHKNELQKQRIIINIPDIHMVDPEVEYLFLKPY